jgi:4-nitrophenyl phosphatase
MDGVIYLGNSRIKSAIKAIKIWRRKNIQVCFLTNNSTKNQLQFAKKLKLMGLSVKKESIISTSFATANYLKENFNSKSKVYVLGSTALKKAIYDNGFIYNENNADVVVVGLDSKISYKKLHIASKLIRNGAKLIGTNSDKLYPGDKDFMPGAGSTVEFIRAASYNAKCFFVGKPNPYFVNSAIQYLKLDKKNVILIGDQLETDILAANDSKIPSILVSTGVKNINKKIKPSMIVNSLMRLPISKN